MSRPPRTPLAPPYDAYSIPTSSYPEPHQKPDPGEVDTPSGPTPRRPAAAPRPLQAAAVVSGLYLVARIIGLGQYIIINRLLPPDATDAYYAAFRLPDVINYLVAGGAMSITFIPIFTALQSSGDEGLAWRFFSTVATLMGSALLLLVMAGCLLVEPLVRVTNPGFTVPAKWETLRLTVTMTRIVLPAQIFFYLGGMIVGVLNSQKRFLAAASTGAVYNVAAIVVGCLLWLWLGVVGFAWGILLGAAIGNFLLPLLAARGGPAEQRLRYRPELDWRQPAVRRFFINALPIMLGVSFPVVDQLVVGWFATTLPKGVLTHLQTGNRVMLAPLGIVGQAASVAAFPYLAANTAAHDWEKFAEFLRSGLRRLMFLTLPLSVLLILLAQPVINVLFRHGQYTQAAADETAVAFAFYCVGLFAWAGQQLVARGFYALQDTLTPTIIGSTIAVVFCLVAWVASRAGVAGLALATSIGAAAHFCGILLALEAKLGSRRFRTSLRLPNLGGLFMRTGAACAVMALAGAMATSLSIRYFSDDNLGDLMRIAGVTVVAGGAFALSAQFFSIPEWAWLRSKLRRRSRRRR